jgi:hypothetical protein
MSFYISLFCNLYFLLHLLNIWEVPHYFKMFNTALAGFSLWFFSANQVTKLCHTVFVLYRPNIRLQSNTTLNFYSSYVVTRYYSITTTEMKFLHASFTQFSYLPISIHQQLVTQTQSDATVSTTFFNAYNSIKNTPYPVLCTIFPASFYYEKK